MRYTGIEVEKVRTQSPGVLAIHGFVTTGTSGAISSSDIPGGGATIAKVGATAGRYTITLAPPAAESVAVLANLKFMGGWACVLGPDTAALTTTKGLVAFFRDDDISTTGAKDGTIELQFVQTDAGNADTELQNNASFYFCIYVGVPGIA